MVAVGWTRTNDLLVMSQTSYQLLHPAWLRRQDSNLRFLTYGDSEIVHFSTPQWCQWLGSNQRPHPYEGCVLNLLNYTGK